MSVFHATSRLKAPIHLVALATCLGVPLLANADATLDTPPAQAPTPVAAPELAAPVSAPDQVDALFVPPAPSNDDPFAALIEIPPLPDPLGQQNILVPAPLQNFVPPPPVAAPPTAPRSETQRISDEEWTVAIVPVEKKNTPSLVSNYKSVYESIPFRRAEYLANPSYRHDTTVEVLFGQMRSTVINRTDTPQRVVNPRPQLTQPYPISKGELYSYWPLLQYSYPLPLLSPIQ